MSSYTVSNTRDFSWLKSKTLCPISDDMYVMEARALRGEIKGAIGMGNWTPSAVQVHIAIDSPIACRELLCKAFNYIFVYSGRHMVYAVVPTIAQSLQMALDLGFTETGRIRGGWTKGEDLVILELTRNNCRFITHMISVHERRERQKGAV